MNELPNGAKRRPCKWCHQVGWCDCFERLRCEQAGQPGHKWCGVCHEHGDCPRFYCIHLHLTLEERV